MTIGEWEAWGLLVFWLMLVTVTAHAGWRRYRLRRASRREDG